MKQFVAIFSLFVVYVLFGSAWVSSASLLPEGRWRMGATAALGLIFAFAFLSLLLLSLRRFFSTPWRENKKTAWRELTLTAVNLALLLSAFAEVYRRFGVVDTSKSGAPETHVFLECLYFSIVTFTTLGYGDFRPVGLARMFACLEAFLGYLVLGILASTGASVLQSMAQQAEGKQKEAS